MKEDLKKSTEMALKQAYMNDDPADYLSNNPFLPPPQPVVEPAAAPVSPEAKIEMAKRVAAELLAA